MSTKTYLQEIARLIDSKLPAGHGFILLTFPFGDSPSEDLDYVSSAERKDAIKLLKDFIIQAGEHHEPRQNLPARADPLPHS